MKPIEILEVNGEEIGLYINPKLGPRGGSILFIPIKELVDTFSIEVASQVASHCLVQLHEINSLGSKLHDVLAFALDLEKDLSNYFEENREERETEKEYNSAKQKLLDAVSVLFEIKTQYAKGVVEQFLNNR